MENNFWDSLWNNTIWSLSSGIQSMSSSSVLPQTITISPNLGNPYFDGLGNIISFTPTNILFESNSSQLEYVGTQNTVNNIPIAVNQSIDDITAWIEKYGNYLVIVAIVGIGIYLYLKFKK